MTLGLNDVAFLGSLNQTPTDPNFANVSLLLHGDGTNGSQAIIDSSPSPNTVTVVGNAQISTAQSKFGGASILFDGNDDYLTLGTGVAGFAFGAGDFTIEAWVYRLNTNTAYIAVGQSNLTTAAGSSWAFLVSSSIVSEVYIGTTSRGATSPNPSINTWAHIAMTRNGNTLRTFLDGNVVGTNTNLGSNSLNTGSTNFPASVGGLANNTGELNGYIDELRITKGVARYTANFTPPTAPFPDA